jgi:hypothetical protein
LKYNLVWDRYFDFGLFSPEVVEGEIAFYLSKEDEFGIPLDSRATFTKSDWLMWVASLATEKQDLSRLVDRLWRFFNETIDRTPMSDWYDTHDGREQSFHNRTVVGGFFFPMLMAHHGSKGLGDVSEKPSQEE